MTLASAGSRVVWCGSFPPRPADPGELPPTLGEHVIRWVEGPGGVKLGEGDYHGQPMKLARWQRYALLKIYELWPVDPAFRSLPPSKWRELRLELCRRYARVLVLLPKGNGKGPFAGSAIGAAELCGAPVMFGGWTDDGEVVGVPRISPILSIGAASWEQANLCFSDLTAAIEQSPNLASHAEVLGSMVQLRDRPGYAKRVSASNSSDGARSSVVVLDECHLLVGEQREQFATIVTGGLAKRRDSLAVFISTAGATSDTFLGRMVDHGKRVNAGQVRDDQFLALIWEGPQLEGEDWDDPDKLRAAVLSCNPAGEDGFLRVDDVVSRRWTISLHDWRRFHLNHFDAGSDEQWLPPGAWEALADPDAPPLADGERIQLALDGSWNHDSTAIVGVSLDRPTQHVEVLGHWERPGGAPADWHVDILSVEQTLRELCGRFRVRSIACDPARWSRTIALLGDEGLPLEVFPQSPAAMGPATEELRLAVVNSLLTHNGDARLAEHFRNARPKVGPFGTQLSKATKSSAHKIDLAVACIMARARALVPDDAPPPDVAFFSFDEL